MYLLRLNRFITKTWRGERYVRGRIYEIQDHALYLEMLGTGFFLEEFTAPGNASPEERKRRARQVMIVRDNGLGDVLMLMPAVQEYQSRHEDLEATFAVGDQYAELISAQPGIFEVIPLSRRHEKRIRNVVDLSWYVERHRDQRTVTRAILFAGELGLTLSVKDLPKIRRPFRILESWRAGPAAHLEAAGYIAGEPLVTLVTRASNHIRSYDRRLLEDVAERLSGQGAWVAVTDGDPAQGMTGERIIDMTGKTTIPELAGLVSMSHCVIGPDTGVLHLAGLMRVPIVALFMTWPAKLRLTGYDAVALAPDGLECSPCFDGGCPGHWCTAMIHPNRVILATARALAPKFRLVASSDIGGSFDDQMIFGNPRTGGADGDH